MAQVNASSVMIKPEQIDGLPILNDTQKEHYKTGLTKLWGIINTSQPGSPEYQTAEAKIRDASSKVMHTIASRQGNARPGSGGGPPRPNPGMQQQQQQQQQQQNMAGMNMGQPSGQQMGQQQGGQPQQQQSGGLTNQQKQELNAIQWNIPQNIVQQGEEAVRRWRHLRLQRAAQIMMRRDQLGAKGKALQERIRNNQVPPQQVQQAKQEMQQCSVEWQLAKQQWEDVKTSAAAGYEMQRTQSQGQQSQQMNGGLPQQQQQQQQQGQEMQRPNTMQNSQQQSQGDVKMNMSADRGSSNSPSQPHGGFQQQAQNQAAPSSAPQNQQNMQQQQPQNMGQQQPSNAHPQQQTPHSATQPQHQQNFPQQQNMGQQQQQGGQRPQMNPQQYSNMQQQQQAAAAAQQQQQHQQSAPRVPQTANQQQQPPPQPLTHQAAVSRAQESYSSQQSQSNAPPQPNPAAGASAQGMNTTLPMNQNANSGGPPSSATTPYPPASATEFQQQKQKFPIPKQLNLDPRAQGPVQGPPQRPTYATAGMMQQPGIQRPAQFTLEGEGDRVLSKRKLDELVRQVTGGGEDGALAPDVEEAVFTLADDFVDNVITSACRLAKLRASQTLELRDVQMVLERNYGIRVPGYAVDEVRTVRKFVPAVGWQSKMQAVQAGKVMGGRSEN